MRAKTNLPKKHSGNHNDVLNFLVKCIELGDDDPKKAAWRIWDEEWMSPNSKTGSDRETLETDCVRTWTKATEQINSGSTKQKRLQDHERLRIARDFVESRVRLDTFLNQHLVGNVITNPAIEYSEYNKTADSLTYIDKHFFKTAFEVNSMSQCNTLKEWGDRLPKWDKKDWIKKLSEYIPAKDPRQAELFLKGWLIRAYIQGVNPKNLDGTSIVNRWFFILHQHRQDSGKSSFLQWIAPKLDWVKLSGLDESKDGYTALAKYLFVQDDELGGLSQVKQHERIKAMISVSKVDVRPPYAVSDINVPRVASFCGSTNNDRVFPSSEGTSRFLTLPLKDQVFNWRGYTKSIDRTKMWAQVKYLACTDWLEVNDTEIVDYRSKTNLGFVREVMEQYAVDRYLSKSKGEFIMSTGDIITKLESMYDLDRLNITTLGQALRDRFGDRVNGKTVDGRTTKGYKVEVLGQTPVSGKGKKQTPKSPF
jgi:hypothetical protein